MKNFEYTAPRSVEEATRKLGEYSQPVLLAGGTDLLVQLRTQRKTADAVIDLKHIQELNEVTDDPARGLTLGAAVPCYRVYDNAGIRGRYPALAQVAGLIGGTQIQNRASIGGNLCNAAPSADAVPLLIALRATCRIAGAKGAREVAVEDFCLSPGRNVLVAGELLVSLHLPPPAARSGAQYLRFIPRNEMDIAVAGAGVAVELEDGTFRSARIALAAVAPRPLFVREAGDWLAGKAVTRDNMRAAAEMAKKAATPITDMRGTTEYRKHLCAVLTRRALETAVENAGRTN